MGWTEEGDWTEAIFHKARFDLSFVRSFLVHGPSTFTVLSESYYLRLNSQAFPENREASLPHINLGPASGCIKGGTKIERDKRWQAPFEDR